MFKMVMYKPNIRLTNNGDRFATCSIYIDEIEYAGLARNYHGFNVTSLEEVELSNFKIKPRGHYTSKNVILFKAAEDVATIEEMEQALAADGYKDMSLLNAEYESFLSNYDIMELNIKEEIVRFEAAAIARIDNIVKRKQALTKKYDAVLGLQNKYLSHTQ